MSKFRLFIENFVVFGLGSIINKMIPFFMLPIVTRLMPDTTYYGLNDLINTAVSFASALAILGMYDAVFRLFFDKDELIFKKTVCSTALCFTAATSILVFVVMLVFQDELTVLLFTDPAYGNLLYVTAISVLVGATNSILQIPTRAMNKRKIFVGLSTVCSVASYALSIPMLLNGYYLMALPLAGLLSTGITGAVFFYLNHGWFDVKLFDKELLIQLLKIAVPLFPIFLIYWVLNSCDRLFISKFLGTAQVGVYSVGAKLASASQLIYTAFAGGWQYFAFSTMNDEKQVENNSKVFEYLGVISFVATTFMCACSYDLFKILFPLEYLDGYTVAPLLFLGPLLLMLYQVAGNQFLVIKKTWPSMIILSSGAVINIIINYYCMPVCGIEGSAIANLSGYLLANIINTIVLMRMNLMVLYKRFIVVAILLIAYMFTWRFMFREDIVVSGMIAVVYTVIAIILYKNELGFLFNKIKVKFDK